MAVYESIKTRVTTEGGLAMRLTANSAMLKGEVVSASLVAGRCALIAANEDYPIGVVYADAVEAGDVWIVYAGMADVLPKDANTKIELGYHVCVSPSVNGRAEGFATVNVNRHWAEIGHCIIPSAENGALARCVLHFN